MSDLTTSTNESGYTHNAPSHHEPMPSHNKHYDPVAHFSGVLLERGDSIIYAVVGVCFFLGALFALGYSFWDFGSTMLNIPEIIAATAALRDPNNPAPTQQAVVADAIIKLVSDLLLVLIIMEVLSTVIHYLKSHATSLRPFLFIGIISATRGVLSIGARLSVENVNAEEFYRSMIELGVNALAILALGITLKLLGRMADDH
jgi:uncharacterized membrane protein (DUF373 family)